MSDYEVLSPWADVDPAPLRGLAPRPGDLSGRAIGLFSNGKRAAELTLGAVERGLLEQFPGAKISRYVCSNLNTPEILTAGKAKFEDWVASVDTVLLAVAD